LCEKYDDEDFKKYYSNILNNVLSGNIYDYYALRNIRGKYQNTYSPNALFESNYINKLDCKIIRLVSNINTIDSKIDNIMTNLEFAKGIKAINCLRLKVEFLEFCMKLVQVTALTINYKLDYELRRKIGNIVGLTIIKNFSQNIESVEDSKKLLSDVKKADALSGARGNSFMQQSVARGMQAAGENGGAAAMGFMGMGMNAAGGVMGAVQQPTQEEKPDPTAELAKYKSMLDQGLITQEDYDAAKKKILGL
jgi:membrane protease subunit (stomatin/prohibitin family)